MKKLMIIGAMLALTVGTYAQTQWKVDPYHSSLNFEIKHSGISMVNGKFTDYTGTLTTQGEELKDAAFDFTVQVKSINTAVDARDEHRSEERRVGKEGRAGWER